MKQKMYSFGCLVAMTLFMAVSIADLHASILEVDTVYSDTTWYADTVHVMKDIVVPAPYTLTIEPGTLVEFQGHFKLKIEGRILAGRRNDEYVTFTVNDSTLLYDLDTTAGGWNGIDFVSTVPDSSKLINCLFMYGKATDGKATWDYNEDAGGIIMCDSASSPLLVENCYLIFSRAVNGGAISVHQSNITIRGCIIAYNYSSEISAISIGYSTAHLNRNTICNNIGEGGCLYLDSTDALLANSVIVNNETGNQAAVGINGAVGGKNIRIFNNVIASNKSLINTSGILVANPVFMPRLINNIIWNNEGLSENYQVWPDTLNTVQYNLIEGGYAGEGNLDDDPLFNMPVISTGFQFDALYADWSLAPSSPCINTGKPDFTIDSLASVIDNYGEPRIQFGRIDMGACEFQGSCTPVYVEDPENLITNGDFGNCYLYPWYIYTEGSIPSAADYMVLDSGLRVMPASLGTSPEAWRIQLGQRISDFHTNAAMKDSVYLLTFDASADANDRPCLIALGLADDPYTVYYQKQISVNKVRASYSYQFKVINTLSTFLLAFHIGSEMTPITFDNVRLVKIPQTPVYSNVRNITNEEMSVYPNPADDRITINAPLNTWVSIYNLTGILLKEVQVNKDNFVLDVGEFEPGTYIIRLISDGNSVAHYQIID